MFYFKKSPYGKIRKNTIFLLVLTFLFCFGPVFASVSMMLDVIFFTALFLVVYLLFWLKYLPPSNLRVFYLILPIFFYIYVSALFYEEAQVADYLRIALKPIRIFTTLIGGFALVLLFKRSGHTHNAIYLFIFLSTFIHALIMIMQLFFPDFRDLIYFYTTSDSIKIEEYSYEYHFRMGGLAGSFGSSTLSVAQAFGVILLPFLINERNFWQRWFLIFCGGIIFFSVIICGRSGLLFLLFFYPISVALARDQFGLRSIFRLFIILLILSGLIIALLYIIGTLNEKSDIYNSLRRTFESIIAFSESGKLEDKTINVLLKHWILPTQPEIFILGSSEFLINTHFERDLNSDIGYIRNLWGMGIFIAIGYWVPYFYFCIKGFLGFKYRKSAKILFIITLISIFLHTKEDVFYSRILLSYFGLILGVYYFEKFPRTKYVRN